MGFRNGFCLGSMITPLLSVMRPTTSVLFIKSIIMSSRALGIVGSSRYTLSNIPPGILLCL